MTKAYPKYKDSGAPWIGKVPENWDVLPNRTLFYEIKERGHIDEELISVTISQGIIRQSDLIANSSKKDSSNEDKSKYKLVMPGDIAYNKMRAWQGAVGVSQYRGIVSPAYIVVRPRRKQNAKYFHYLLRTPAFAKEAERWSYGITSDQWSLRPEHFKMIYCSLPSEEEQEAIVGFLDNIEVRVRRYIRAKQRVIKLLNEQKQSMVDLAITRGVNPNARFKSSGVDWLGDIPEHWEVKRLKNIAEVILGKMLKTTPEVGYFKKSYLRSANIQWFKPDIEDVSEMYFSERELKKYRLHKEDILVSEGGEAGRCCLWSDELTECYIQNSVHKITCNKDISPKYLLFYLSFLVKTGYITSIVDRVSIGHLTREKIVAIPLIIPSFHEQKRIVEYVEIKTMPLNQSISQCEKEINLISEYRTRLISDVVTGKIDVRDIKLPEIEDITDSEQIEEREILEDVEDTEEVVNADE